MRQKTPAVRPFVILLLILAAVLVFYWWQRPKAPVPAPQVVIPCGVHCGTERWLVKTLSDADRARVDFTPRETTVGWLVSLPAPAHSPEDSRIAPIETQTFQVRARLVGFKQEPDQDFHIVIADLDDPGKTMIVEIPSGNCAGACASGRAAEFEKARAAFVSRFEEPSSRFRAQRSTLTVVVTGVGFFDRVHGQRGVAPNGIELHPVLAIE